VSIFRRRKAPQDAAEGGSPVEPVEEDDTATQDGGTNSDEQAAPRGDGPFDHAEVEGREDRVDLGALWLRGVPGMELRLEVDQQSQQVHATTVVIGDSALQLQAFAAPRSSGLWDEIRGEIAEAVERQGGTAEEHRTDLGTSLRTRMPSEAGGRTVFAPATFIGVDGPRWFLRGVLSGRAAIDDRAAAPLLEIFRTVVVVRGGEPMAPRELLPLRLPTDSRAQQSDDDQERPDIDPFERGPEITEVR